MNIEKTILLVGIFLIGSCGHNLKESSVSSDIKDIISAQWDSVNFQKTEYFFHDQRIGYLQQLMVNRPKQELLIKGLIGDEYLKKGDNEKAIETFKEIIATLDQAGVQDGDLMRHTLKNLAVSYLRKAEIENCLHNHTYQSCIFPIENAGIHHFSEGSEFAVNTLNKLLAINPKDYTAIWLLNLAHMTLNQYPEKVPKDILIPEKVFASELDFPRFRDVAKETKTDLSGLSGGVCVDDFNNDGLLDIIASSWGMEDQIQFLVNNGDGTFQNHTQQAGLTGTFGGLNLVHADYDNDGWNDFLILRGAWFGEQGNIPNSLLRNKGDGTFEDVTIESGLLTYAASQTASWADVNNDGWLDLFVGNEFKENELFISNRDGTFSNKISIISNVVDSKGYVKGCTFGDINNDGKTDLYISYYNRNNLLLLNQSNGDQVNFKDISKKAGVLNPKISFPTWMWDYDNDGWLDIFVSGYGNNSGKTSTTQVLASYFDHQTGAEPRLYRNNGNNTFSNVTRRVGLDRTFFTMGSNFGDLNNDGWLDCYLGTGDPDYASVYPNRMFVNEQGKRFLDVTTDGGFGHIQKGHGVAFIDLDNDGDQDVYQVMGGAHEGDVFQNVLFENPGTSNSNWLTLKLEGIKSNRSAIGARVSIETSKEDGEKRTYHHVVTTGGSFGSGSLQIEAGLGGISQIDKIEITWPNQELTTSIFEDITPNQMLHIKEGEKNFKIISNEPFKMGQMINDPQSLNAGIK